MKAKLTDNNFWDEEWEKVELPSRLDSDGYFYLCFDQLFNDRLQPGEKTILEIGCAPGRFLIYFAERFGYSLGGIEASPIGYSKTIENMNLAGIAGDIVHGDFLDQCLQNDNYDVVFSAGFIEHFSDPIPILKRKFDLLKPGGVLITTIPNFVGVGGLYRKYMNKELYQKHRIIRKEELLKAYDNLGLDKISAGYFGSLRFRLPSPIPHTYLKGKIHSLAPVIDKYVVLMYQKLGLKIEGPFVSSYIYAYGTKPN